MGCPKSRTMTNEAIDPGFYILAALSAVLFGGFIASHWLG
jgi:hypothetical protein